MDRIVQRWKAAQEHFRSIKAKARFMTIVGLLAMLMAGASMLISVVDLEQNASVLRKNLYVFNVTVRDMKSDVQRLDTELERLSETSSPLALRRFSRSMDQIDANMTQRFDVLLDGFDALQVPVEGVRTAYASWLPVRDAIERAFADDRKVLAYTLAKTEGAGLIADIEKRLDALLANADIYTEQIWAEQERVLHANTAKQCAVLLLVLIVLGAIARFINQSIVRPTNEISAAIRMIATGRLSVPIPHTNRLDEIGEIARSAQVFLEHSIAIRDSSFDILTELPTRRQIHDHVKIMELDPDYAGRSAAVMHIDLDGFSEVNSACGRSIGDRLLVQIADILRKNARLGDFVARDGPDSFVLIALGRSAEEAKHSHAKPLRQHISEIVDVDGHDVEISCCIGITNYVPGSDLESMLAYAEQALAEAKRAGRGSIAVYTEELDARLQSRRETLTGLRFALAHDEIVPYFQPQVDTSSGRLSGMEALVRWNHPEHGVLAPWQFLGIAEEAGLASAIMDTMMAKSMETLAMWRKRGLDVDRVSLNFAAADLRQPEFADRLSLQIERFQLEPDDICIEVLESAMIEDADDPVSRTLDRLADLGFPIELDDFGTGHAAVSTFNLIDLKGVKIDRSFITRLHERPDNLKVVRGMLLIANAMGVTSIAEGVENVEERALLTTMGCDVIQGFLIAPPMSPGEATDWIETYRPQAVGAEVESA